MAEKEPKLENPTLTHREIEGYKKRIDRLVNTYPKLKQLQELDNEKAEYVQHNFDARFEEKVQDKWQEIQTDKSLKTLTEKKKALQIYITKLFNYFKIEVDAHIGLIKKARKAAMDKYFGPFNKQSRKYELSEAYKGSLQILLQNKFWYWDSWLKDERLRYLKFAEHVAQILIPLLRKRMSKDKGSFINYQNTTEVDDSCDLLSAHFTEIEGALKDLRIFDSGFLPDFINNDSPEQGEARELCITYAAESSRCDTAECKKGREQLVKFIQKRLSEARKSPHKKTVFVDIRAYASEEGSKMFNHKLTQQRAAREEYLLRKMLGKDARHVVFKKEFTTMEGYVMDLNDEFWLKLSKKEKDEFMKADKKNRWKMYLKYIFPQNTPTIRDVFLQYNKYRELMLKKGPFVAFYKKPEIFSGKKGQRLLEFLDEAYGTARRVYLDVYEKYDNFLKAQKWVDEFKDRKQKLSYEVVRQWVFGEHKDPKAGELKQFFEVSLSVKSKDWKGEGVIIKFKDYCDGIDYIGRNENGEMIERLPCRTLDELEKWLDDKEKAAKTKYKTN